MLMTSRNKHLKDNAGSSSDSFHSETGTIATRTVFYDAGGFLKITAFATHIFASVAN